MYFLNYMLSCMKRYTNKKDEKQKKMLICIKNKMIFICISHNYDFVFWIVIFLSIGRIGGGFLEK